MLNAADQEQWDAAWRAPALDTDRIGLYLDAQADRFDLFSADCPFWQSAHVTEATQDVRGLDVAAWSSGAPQFAQHLMRAPAPVEAADAATHVPHHRDEGREQSPAGPGTPPPDPARPDERGRPAPGDDALRPGNGGPVPGATGAGYAASAGTPAHPGAGSGAGAEQGAGIATGAHPGPGPEGGAPRAEKAPHLGPLFPHDDAEKLGRRMHQAVARFMDGPRAAVEEADHVMEEIAVRLTELVAERRRTLRRSWEATDESTPATSDTEKLRLALRDYRELADRLLHR